MLAKFAMAAALVFCASGMAAGQDLSPRAYVITPLHSDAIILTYTYNGGSLLFDGAVPITGATANISVPILSYYHSLNFFGRSANFTASLPYGVGNFQGHAFGAEQHAHRSGLLDSVYRFSVNLKGAPAMPTAEDRKWRQKMLIGASLKIIAPTGQYDPTKLINWGNNRWAFRPELGYSERWGHFVVDACASAWFVTTNQEFFSFNQLVPGLQTQSESSVVAFEGHLSYDFKPRLWLSFDANFWHGGETSLSGIPNPVTGQRSSRIGVTAAIPISKYLSQEISYNNGAFINYGGNYQNVSVDWQYSWIGRPN